MAFKLKRESTVTLLAEERLYLTADQKEVVREGDKRAAILLAGKGQPIPGHFLHLVETRAELKPEPKSEPGVEPEKRRNRVASATSVR